MILLWLDDIRNPFENDWLAFSPIEQPFDVVWVKSYNEFVDYIQKNGLPDGICFDHDLGVKFPNIPKEEFLKRQMIEMSTGYWREGTIENPTGYDCAKWLVNYCIDRDLNLPKYNIQSANPVGKVNIDGLLKSFIRQKNKD